MVAPTAFGDSAVVEPVTEGPTSSQLVSPAPSTAESEEKQSSNSSNKGSRSPSISDLDHVATLSSRKPAPSGLRFLFRSKKGQLRDGELDSVATQPSIFDDTVMGKYSLPSKNWENNHRFDPDFRWTWREEFKLVRKMDLRIAFWAFLMFFCLDLDRENIQQANSDNLLKDLGLTQSDYNLGNTFFRLSFLIAELPSQMISKRLGPDRWIPIQICIFSAFSFAQFWMKGRASFLALRWMIGTFSGGFIPDTVNWLAFFYTTGELPLRLAIFWVSNYLVKIVSPFLALGLLRIRAGGHAGWQYLFLIEGLFTFLIGVLSFVQMPGGPTQTQNWLYRKGWFTEREEKIIVNRIIRDDPTKGTMHNREGIDFRQFRKTLMDYDLWPMYLLGLVFLLPTYPLSNYLTLQLKKFGFSTAATNALSVPAPALGLVLLIIIALISEIVDNRAWVCMSQSVWNAIFMFALVGLPATASRWSYWVVASLQQAYPYVHAVQVAWISRQSGSVRTRTVSAAIYNMAVQVSAIIGSQVYQASDAPLYRKGNLAMAILSTSCCLLYVAIYFYYGWRNKVRDRKWNAMTREEQLHYLSTTTDEGNRRLDFRFLR